MAARAADRQPSAGSYLLLLLGSTSYFLYLFAWFSLPAFLAPVIAELGLTTTEAGFVAGAIQLIYVPLGLVSGLAVDRIGSRNAIGAGMALIGGAHAIRSGATGFLTLLAPTLLLGVGGTAITFGLPKLVSELFPSDRIGTMSSVYLVGSGLGAAAAFGIGRPVVGPALGGWRPAFLWAGVLVIGFAVVWFAVSGLVWGRVEQFDDTDDPPTFSFESIRADVRAVVSHPGLRLLVVIGTMQLFINHGLQAWLATVLEVRGLTAGVAGTVVSLLIIARIAGTVTIPPLSDRLSARRPTVIGCGVLATIGTAGVVLTGASAWATVGVVAVIGIGLGGVAPLVRAIPIELDGIGPRLTATANGLIYTVGEVGGFMGPFMIGGVRDVTGSFLPGFAVLAAGSVVIVLAGVAMTEPARA